MATRKTLGRKRSRSSWKMRLSAVYLYSKATAGKPPAKSRSRRKTNSMLQEKLAEKKEDLELMFETVGNLREETEKDKKSLAEDKENIQQIGSQLEEWRTQIRQAQTVNAMGDVYVKFGLAILEAQDAGDSVTADNLYHDLREMMRACGLG